MKIALLLLVKLLLLLSAGAQRFVNVSTYKELKFAIDGAVSDNVTDLRIRLSHGNVVLLDTLNANGLDTFHLIGELDSTSSTSSVLSCGPGVASALVSNAQHVLLANLTVRHCSGPAIWLNSSISTADEASPPVTWELQQITFAENQAQVRARVCARVHSHVCSTSAPLHCTPTPLTNCVPDAHTGSFHPTAIQGVYRLHGFSPAGTAAAGQPHSQQQRVPIQRRSRRWSPHHPRPRHPRRRRPLHFPNQPLQYSLPGQPLRE